MSKSTDGLRLLLDRLSALARDASLTDSAWATRAGLRKETLSRLRRRNDCDWQTLQALAGAVGQSLELRPAALPPASPDGQLPLALSRDDEERLLRLLRSGNRDVHEWTLHGPRFFMAGLAVLVAGSAGFDRGPMLELAERLHCGISEPAVFGRWLQSAPVEPSRFLPQLLQPARNAA